MSVITVDVIGHAGSGKSVIAQLIYDALTHAGMVTTACNSNDGDSRRTDSELQAALMSLRNRESRGHEPLSIVINEVQESQSTASLRESLRKAESRRRLTATELETMFTRVITGTTGVNIGELMTVSGIRTCEIRDASADFAAYALHRIPHTSGRSAVVIKTEYPPYYKPIPSYRDYTVVAIEYQPQPTVS